MGWSADGRPDRVTPAQEADVQIALGRVNESQGNFEQAEAAYRAALSRDKSRGDAHLRLANMLTLKGEYRRAREQYQKAIEILPGNADVFCDMGYSEYLQRNWDDAQRNLKQAIAIQPDHRRAHNNLAVLLAHLGKTQEALAEFRKAGNSPASSHANLAFSLSLEKNWTAAREELRLAAAGKPDSEALKSRLRQLDSLIASHEGRSPQRGATLDRSAVTASARPAAPSQATRQISTTITEPRRSTPVPAVPKSQSPAGEPAR
jgi:tetratricopeptide (TPR) repeat protein